MGETESQMYFEKKLDSPGPGDPYKPIYIRVRFIDWLSEPVFRSGDQVSYVAHQSVPKDTPYYSLMYQGDKLLREREAGRAKVAMFSTDTLCITVTLDIRPGDDTPDA